MNIFDCPRYKIDAAQKWHKVVGPLHEQKKRIFTRRKLNTDNDKHFWSFCLVQDWCKTSHISEHYFSLPIPKSILKMTKNHTIEAYKHYCLEMNIPLKISNSSLWGIFNEIKLSHNALSGLDITAAGLRAFSSFNIFWANLIKIIWPIHNSIFGIFDPIWLKLITRLQLGLSHLNEQGLTITWMTV